MKMHHPLKSCRRARRYGIPRPSVLASIRATNRLQTDKITNGLLTRARPAVIMADVMTNPYVLSTFVLIVSAALTGCARPGAALPIADLREIPQNCRGALGDSFVDRALIAPDAQRRLAQAYRRTILSPWREDYSPSQAAQVRALLDNYIRNPECGYAGDSEAGRLSQLPAPGDHRTQHVHTPVAHRRGRVPPAGTGRGISVRPAAGVGGVGEHAFAGVTCLRGRGVGVGSVLLRGGVGSGWGRRLCG